MHEVLVNRLGGLSLPRKSVVRLTDRPDMTLDVYRGRKTTNQQSVMHIGKDNPVFKYEMTDRNENSYKLKEVTSEKDLGITFQQNMRFEEHITVFLRL